MRKYDKKNNWIKGGRKSNHFYVLRVVLINNNNNFFFLLFLFFCVNRVIDMKILKNEQASNIDLRNLSTFNEKEKNRKVEKETLKMQSGTLKRSTLNMATFRFQFL
jgi:hypothetical protein